MTGSDTAAVGHNRHFMELRCVLPLHRFVLLNGERHKSGIFCTDLAGPARHGSEPSACTAGPGACAGQPAAWPAKSVGRRELDGQTDRQVTKGLLHDAKLNVNQPELWL